MPKGKCLDCRMQYVWDNEDPRHTLRLRDAFCPGCGKKLDRTSALTRGLPIKECRPNREAHPEAKHVQSR